MKKRIFPILLLCITLLVGCLPFSEVVSPPPTSTSDLPQSTSVPETTAAPTPETTTGPVTETTVPPETTAGPVTETTSAPETTAEPATETTLPPETTAEPETLDLANTVFLTFDDGPCRGKTEEVLRILDEYDICATFFTVGRYVNLYPDLVHQIVDGGHLLGCHSYSHDYRQIYASVDAFTADIARWENAIRGVIGELPEARVYRFPGGTTNTLLVDNDLYPAFLTALSDAGYRPYDWVLATNDLYLADKRDDQTMEEYFFATLNYTLALANRYPTLPRVMLVHDTSADTVATLPAVLDYLIEKGYSFATLDKLDAPYIFRPIEQKG